MDGACIPPRCLHRALSSAAPFCSVASLFGYGIRSPQGDMAQATQTRNEAKATPKKPTPFKQLNEHEQAARLHTRGRDLKRKVQRGQIVQLMHDKEEVITDIVHFLQSVGVRLLEPSPKKRKGAEDGADDEADGLESRLRTAIADSNPANWVPHRYIRLGNCSVALLKKLLSQLEEISMSEWALRSITAKGTLQAKIDKCCERMELVTGQGKDFQLTGDMRYLPTLIGYLKACNQRRNLRGRDVRLPADWGESGAYKCKDVDDQIMVFELSTGNSIVIPADRLPKGPHGRQVIAGMLVLHANYSEKLAYITIGASQGSLHISSLGQFFDFQDNAAAACSDMEFYVGGKAGPRRPARAMIEGGGSEDGDGSVLAIASQAAAGNGSDLPPPPRPRRHE